MTWFVLLCPSEPLSLRGIFLCLERHHHSAGIDLSRQLVLQKSLDGLPGLELPHPAVGLDKADAPLIDADQENTLRLLYLLEGTVGPQADNRLDGFVGL